MPDSPPAGPTGPRDRRQSKEWGTSPDHVAKRLSDTMSSHSSQDASKVPPSQFQKRKGSVYATPGSRDGHVDSGKVRDKSFHQKLKAKVRSLARVLYQNV